MPNSIDCAREKSNNIRKLQAIFVSQKSPIVQDAIMKYLFGNTNIIYFNYIAVFSINFTPLWDQASQSLSAIAASQPSTFWKTFKIISASMNLAIESMEMDETDNRFEFFSRELPFSKRPNNEWNLSYRKSYMHNSSTTHVILINHLTLENYGFQ